MLYNTFPGFGTEKGVRAYQFLKEPLIRRFGKEWYAELCLTYEMYLKEYDDSANEE